MTILPIVEGHAELDSIPILLRRRLQQTGAFHVQVSRPFRVKRNRVVRQGELERAIEQGIRDRENVTGILVILDADDDCPAELGPQLRDRARQTTQLPIMVILATREMEAWFLGAKESLRGVCGIMPDATAPGDPESIRGAKERLSRNMQAGRRYLDVDDQAPLAQQMDFEAARRQCRSFDKFLQDADQLVAGLPNP